MDNSATRVYRSHSNTDFGGMKTHEERAITTGQMYDPSKEIPGEVKEELPTSKNGTIGDLIWPIATLFLLGQLEHHLERVKRN